MAKVKIGVPLLQAALFDDAFVQIDNISDFNPDFETVDLEISGPEVPDVDQVRAVIHVERRRVSFEPVGPQPDAQSSGETGTAKRTPADVDAAIFQRHTLLRTYGEDGHVLPVCMQASHHIERLISLVAQQRAKLRDAVNRLETIRETHPDISLDFDIDAIRRVLGD